MVKTDVVAGQRALPAVVDRATWQAERDALLVTEKAHTRARDALAAERRRMPWTAVEKEYRFDGPDVPGTLLDLFAGRRQLIVFRAFFEPGVRGWPEHACRGCSLVADQVAHSFKIDERSVTPAGLFSTLGAAKLFLISGTAGRAGGDARCLSYV